jgi:hypothetical protein
MSHSEKLRALSSLSQIEMGVKFIHGHANATLTVLNCLWPGKGLLGSDLQLPSGARVVGLEPDLFPSTLFVGIRNICVLPCFR